MLNSDLQLPVVNEWDVNSREKVVYNSLKKWKIVLQELRDIGVSHGSDEHDILLGPGVLSPKRTRHDQYRFYCSHTEVIVILLGELLRGQLVKHNHLSGKLVGGLEALTVQDDLGNESVVGNHHRYWSE